MSSAPLAIFRCDADRSLGSGHVIRCMGLAEALIADGWAVAFAVSSATPDLVPALMQRSWNVRRGFDSKETEAALLHDAWPAGTDLIVIDHYARGFSEELVFVPWARRRLVIDDLADRPHSCELLCDQTIGRQAEEYVGLVPADCQVLAGGSFAILRSEFARARGRVRLRDGGPLQRIVVSPGMVDAPNITKVVLAGLEQFSLKIDVVLGSQAPHRCEIEAYIAEHRDSAIRLHTDLEAEAMASLLVNCDLAIGAGGISSLERCCLGVPALVVVLAGNQSANVDSLVRCGAARSLGSWQSLSPDMISAAVADLMQNPHYLLDMRRAALQQTDGRGAQRIASALRPSRTKEGARVALRKASASDAETLFLWQQAPSTRRFARNPAIPSWSEHEEWLKRKLEDPATHLEVIVVGGKPVGAVRLDPAKPSTSLEQCYEVSVFVAPEFHRRGIGLAALEEARRLVPEAELQATVLEGNMASHSLFRHAGYHLFGGGYRRLPSIAMQPVISNFQS